MWLMTPRETEKSWKRVIARISYGSQSTQHTIIQGEIEKSWKRVLARISSNLLRISVLSTHTRN